MSGPKVVRIVTREEILAICEGHLRRLQRAFEHWQQHADAIGELDEETLAATRARHARLRQLMQDDRLAELQKDVPLEIGFLERDLSEREERAVDRAARERGSRRRLREHAALLLRALEPAAAGADPLVEALQGIMAGRVPAGAEALLAEGHARLSRGTMHEESPSEGQRALARALRAGETGESSRWVAEEHGGREPRLERIDQYIARLQTLHGAGSAEPFLQRLLAIEREPVDGRRRLLLDSLVLDIAAAAAGLDTRREKLAALRSLAAELEMLPGAMEQALAARVEACLSMAVPDLQLVDILAQECGVAIAGELERRAAVARRIAVLEGLASLGYEVREGMETAWAEAGRVVLRKPATPGYGVEVGGRAEAGRLQVRAVSLSEANNRARDRDIETIWCGEFSRLRSLLARQGSELVVEKALGVGEVPLKLVESGSDSQAAPAAAATRPGRPAP